MSRAANVVAFPHRRATPELVRSAEARRAASEERVRIARELHDVVAYSYATISIQAGVAAHVLGERPEQALEALETIKAASKEALGELRAILGMLRRLDDSDARSCSTRLERVDALAAGATAAGLPTRTRVDGRPRPLPAAVDHAAFRIVQESLANALRHAGRASAVVTLAYERTRLVIEVEDDGRGVGHGDGDVSGGSGLGIAGMAERALELGGEFEAGPRPGGGFRVRACLPCLGRS